MKTLTVLFAIVLAVCLYFYSQRPIHYPPGILIATDPVQINLGEGQPEIEYGEFRLKPLARFSIDARVLHRKVYRYDRGSDLVPVDLALGWGPMSDEAVLDQMKISQSMRFYWYQYQSPPIPKDQIISHSTNVHVIPANAEIESFCKKLRSGELVHFEGELVEATGPEIGTWRSSLERTDSGNGACELMLVEDCSKLDNPTERRGTLVRR